MQEALHQVFTDQTFLNIQNNKTQQFNLILYKPYGSEFMRNGAI